MLRCHPGREFHRVLQQPATRITWSFDTIQRQIFIWLVTVQKKWTDISTTIENAKQPRCAQVSIFLTISRDYIIILRNWVDSKCSTVVCSYRKKIISKSRNCKCNYSTDIKLLAKSLNFNEIRGKKKVFHRWLSRLKMFETVHFV